MRVQRSFVFLFVLITATAFSGCSALNLGPRFQPPKDSISTEVAQTVVAVIVETQRAAAPQATRVAETEAARIELAVGTIQAKLVNQSTTAIPTTILVIPPGHTPAPTDTLLPPTPTLTPLPLNCDQADFLGDYSPSSSALLYPGQVFRKVWRFQNVGACTWTPDYRLAMINGDFQGAISIPMPSYIRPGQTVDIAFALVAPSIPGNYNSYWNLKNSNNQYFGIGPNGETPLTVQASVIPAGSGIYYDFATNYCLAEWRSRRGIVPCQGNQNEPNGVVSFINYPETANGLVSGPAIWMHPDNSNNGWISGTYPPVLIRQGDHLRTQIVCLADFPNCDITMQIEYELPNGIVQTLGQWRQTSGGRLENLDLDLSTLAGQSISFIFTVIVQNNQRVDANGVWIFPRIGP